jgi:predicted amidohydrolase
MACAEHTIDRTQVLRINAQVNNSMGKVVLTYSKVFLCTFGQEALHKEQYQSDDIGQDYNCSPGATFDVCELANEQGVVKVGSMICADREFPEAAGALMKNGAELIIVPSSCNWDEVRDCHKKRGHLKILSV